MASSLGQNVALVRPTTAAPSQVQANGSNTGGKVTNGRSLLNVTSPTSVMSSSNVKQLYQMVNVNVNGVIKSMMVPVQNGSPSLPTLPLTSSATPVTSKPGDNIKIVYKQATPKVTGVTQPTIQKTGPQTVTYVLQSPKTPGIAKSDVNTKVVHSLMTQNSSKLLGTQIVKHVPLSSAVSSGKPIVNVVHPSVNTGKQLISLQLPPGNAGKQVLNLVPASVNTSKQVVNVVAPQSVNTNAGKQIVSVVQPWAKSATENSQVPVKQQGNMNIVISNPASFSTLMGIASSMAKDSVLKTTAPAVVSQAGSGAVPMVMYSTNKAGPVPIKILPSPAQTAKTITVPSTSQVKETSPFIENKTNGTTTLTIRPRSSPAIFQSSGELAVPSNPSPVEDMLPLKIGSVFSLTEDKDGAFSEADKFTDQTLRDSPDQELQPINIAPIPEDLLPNIDLDEQLLPGNQENGNNPDVLRGDNHQVRMAQEAVKQLQRQALSTEKDLETDDNAEDFVVLAEWEKDNVIVSQDIDKILHATSENAPTSNGTASVNEIEKNGRKDVVFMSNDNTESNVQLQQPSPLAINSVPGTSLLSISPGDTTKGKGAISILRKDITPITNSKPVVLKVQDSSPSIQGTVHSIQSTAPSLQGATPSIEVTAASTGNKPKRKMGPKSFSRGAFPKIKLKKKPKNILKRVMPVRKWRRQYPYMMKCYVMVPIVKIKPGETVDLKTFKEPAKPKVFRPPIPQSSPVKQKDKEKSAHGASGDVQENGVGDDQMATKTVSGLQNIPAGSISGKPIGRPIMQSLLKPVIPMNSVQQTVVSENDGAKATLGQLSSIGPVFTGGAPQSSQTNVFSRPGPFVTPSIQTANVRQTNPGAIPVKGATDMLQNSGKYLLVRTSTGNFLIPMGKSLLRNQSGNGENPLSKKEIQTKVSSLPANANTPSDPVVITKTNISRKASTGSGDSSSSVQVKKEPTTSGYGDESRDEDGPSPPKVAKTEEDKAAEDEVKKKRIERLKEMLKKQEEELESVRKKRAEEKSVLETIDLL